MKNVTWCRRLAILCACTAISSWGVDYQWVGGTSEWTAPDNWSPNTGYPNAASDTATFNTTADLSLNVATPVAVGGIVAAGSGKLILSGAALALGQGGLYSTAGTTGAVVTVENNLILSAANTVVSNLHAAVHLKGVISGEGGILKGGAGRLHLHGDNTFAGGLDVEGTQKTPEGENVHVSGSTKDGGYVEAATPGDSSGVVAYHVHALGTGEAIFDRNWTSDNGSGTRLTFRDCSGTVTNYIQIANDRVSAKGVIGYAFEVFNGDLTFTGTIKTKYRAVLRFCSANTTTFTGALEHGNYLIFNCLARGVKVFVNHSLSGSCEFVSTYPEDTEVHLGAASANFNLFLGACRLVLDGENCLATTLPYDIYFEHDKAVLDLNGFGQTVSGVTLQPGAKNKAKAQITSPEGHPAQIIFNLKKDYYYASQFTGSAGFAWNSPDGDYTMMLSNAVVNTRGAIDVAHGTVLLDHGTTVATLGQLTVADGAAFTIGSAAGAVGNIGKVAVGEAARVTLAGRRLVVGTMTVGDAPVPEGTTMTAANYPSLISGDGEIYVSGAREPNMWKGTAGANWNDPANWSAGVVPTAEQDAYITGSSVTVSDATPRAHAIYLGTEDASATLIMTNAASSLNARDIVIGARGCVQCAAAVTNDAALSRIHIVCDNLTIVAGGRITADGCGYRGALWELAHDTVAKHVVTHYGFGPGVPDSDPGMGGSSHGGRGASRQASGSVHACVYGDAAQPTTAGSGGSLPIGYGGYPNGYWLWGANGGGIIRIEAAGTVIVDGAISANGQNSNASVGNRDTAGAGGSVWITCQALKGTGVISAAGGSSGDPRKPIMCYRNNGTSATDNDTKYGAPAGGGRVAVDYDPVAQAKADARGLLISAAAGEYLVNSSLATRDNYEGAAENGTLHFTDETLARQLFGNGLSGRIVGLKTLAFDGDLAFTRGFVSTMEEGFTLSVSGDLTLTGKDARLEVGGVAVTNYAAVPTVWGGRELNRLTVGGDFSVAEGASFVIRAAETNETMAWGGEVTVVGQMTVGSNGYVYAASDGKNLGSARFCVTGDVSIDRFGVVSADARGGLAACNVTVAGTLPCGQSTRGYGPGGGVYCASAGHGGAGKIGQAGDSSIVINDKSAAGTTYDDPWLPTLPGSGGGSSGYAEGGTGGGVVYLVSAATLNVQGRVSADGGSVAYAHASAGCCLGTGSGGTVFLAGKTVAVAETASITARGGAAFVGRTPGWQASGGGGCVAIWTGADYLLSGVYHAKRLSDQPVDMPGVFDVAGGGRLYNYYAPYQPKESDHDVISSVTGEAGTLRFGVFTAPLGTHVFLR